MAGNNNNNASNNSTPEAWLLEKQMAEKQGSDNSQAWMAEKLGNTPNEWIAEKQGLNDPQAWMAEKLGQGDNNPQTWMAEKLGQGGHADWIAEKQGLSSQTIVRKRSSAVIWSGLLAVLVVVVATTLVLVFGGVIHPKPTPTAVVVVPTPTPTVVVVSREQQETAASLTSIATQKNQADQLYQKGVDASGNSQTWEEAIRDFEQANSLSPNYKNANTYLITLYEEEGKALVTNAQGDGEAAITAVQNAYGYFQKALKLLPTNDAGYANVANWQEEAGFYATGLKEYDQNNWEKAIENLAPLYNKEPNYKDATQLLYNAYMNYGDSLVATNHSGEALTNYQNAAKLPFSDNSVAKAKVTALQQQFGITPKP